MALLVPDMNHTEWVDVALLRLEAAGMDAEALKYEAVPGVPAVSIGFIPSRKLSGVRHRYSELDRGCPKKPGTEVIDYKALTAAQMDAITDMDREIVRWGVRGHRDFGFDYATDQAEAGPLKRPVASWECVDVYERLEILSVLSARILRFNSLAEEKKSQS